MQHDETAAQAGAALALIATIEGGVRLGADRAGAPRRSSEAIARFVVRHLLEELASEGDVDRFTADQIIPFAALAAGETTLRLPRVTEHVRSAIWLASELLGARVALNDQLLIVHGVGYRQQATPARG